MRALEIYLDFISPYAYLAWTQIYALAARHDAIVIPRPILFAALLDANATKGPAEIPAKRVWVFKDTSRRAAYAGVPFSPPPAHPFNPLLALRIASREDDRDAQRRVIDALFRATWGGGPGVEGEDNLRGLLRAAGVDADASLAWGRSDEAKALLRARTAEALARGVFGVPTMTFGDELFWGYDSLDHVERALEGRDVLDPGALARWSDLPATARRRASG